MYIYIYFIYIYIYIYMYMHHRSLGTGLLQDPSGEVFLVSEVPLQPGVPQINGGLHPEYHARLFVGVSLLFSWSRWSVLIAILWEFIAKS